MFRSGLPDIRAFIAAAPIFCLPTYSYCNPRQWVRPPYIISLGWEYNTGNVTVAGYDTSPFLNGRRGYIDRYKGRYVAVTGSRVQTQRDRYVLRFMWRTCLTCNVVRAVSKSFWRCCVSKQSILSDLLNSDFKKLEAFVRLITLIYKISLFATSRNERTNSYVNWCAEHENHNENASLATVFEVSSLTCTTS